MKRLEFLSIKLCEYALWGVTFFEKDSLCQKPSDKCKYCKKHDEETYFCNKKTYTGRLLLIE